MLVLIIDPDITCLEKSEAVFRKRGIKAVTFHDAMAAVKYGYNHKVDIVYTEVIMPHISGCDVIKLLKQRHPAIESYFLTKNAEYLDIAKRYPIDGYYIKPFRKDFQNENLLIKVPAVETKE